MEINNKTIVKKAYETWSALPGNADYISRKGYTQEAAGFFLTYFLHSEGLIETEAKADIIKWLNTPGVGFLNFSQHEQFLCKEGCVTKPKDLVASLSS